MIEAYRLLFKIPDTPETPKRLDHSNPDIKELIRQAVKQEAVNLLEKITTTWTLDFKGSTTRVYSDGKEYTLEINKLHFDALSEDGKVFVLLRELQKMRLGYVKPNEYMELTAEQNISLDLYASDFVGVNEARIFLNQLVFQTSKEINNLKPRVGILNRLNYGYSNLKCPNWLIEAKIDFNMYIGAVTEVMKDEAPEQLEMFNFNERLKNMNQLSGYRSTPMSPTIHQGFYLGELSFMDVKA